MAKTLRWTFYAVDTFLSLIIQFAHLNMSTVYIRNFFWSNTLLLAPC